MLTAALARAAIGATRGVASRGEAAQGNWHVSPRHRRCRRRALSARRVDARAGVKERGDQVIREDPAVRSSYVRGRGTETSAEERGTYSGRHAQTYNTRVQSKVRSLANLAAASATC